MPPDRNVLVFEAANDDLNEVYLAWTFRPKIQAIAESGERPPSPIAWHSQRQHITSRSLELNPSKQEAQAFVFRRVAEPLPDGWEYARASVSKTRSATPLADTQARRMARVSR